MMTLSVHPRLLIEKVMRVKIFRPSGNCVDVDRKGDMTSRRKGILEIH
jgi:hypothetical protein